MGHQHAGNPASFPVDYTIPDDGDPRSALSVNVAFEALGDRTAFLKVRTDRLEPIAFAALAALAAPTNGLIRLVKDVGFYQFDSASVLTANATTIIVPTDATPGRWIWLGNALLNASYGMAANGSNGQLIVQGSAFPTFSSPRSRVRSVSLSGFQQTAGLATRAKTAPFGVYSVTVGGDAACVSGGLKFINAPSGSQSMGVQLCLDPYVHDGATLSTVKIQVQGAAGHAAMPGTSVSLGVFRQTKNASGLTALRSASDYFTDPTASTASYQATHSLDYNGLNQFNVIDTSAYSYFLHVWDEFGANALAGAIIHGVELTFTSIADMRFP